MCSKKLAILFFIVFLFLAVFAQDLILAQQTGEEPGIHGGMQLSLPNSGLKLQDLNLTLNAWENISSRFQTELTALRLDLLTALKDAEQSRTSSVKWMTLYENSLSRITNLEQFSEQIGQRMQERDEDLAQAYDIIDEQDKVILKKDNTILKMGITIGIFGLIIIAGIVIIFKPFSRKLCP